MPRIISRAALWSGQSSVRATLHYGDAATCRRSSRRIQHRVVRSSVYIGSSQEHWSDRVLRSCSDACIRIHLCLIRGWTSTRANKAAGNFFVSPLGSTARSRRRVGRRFIVRQAQRLRRSGRAAAARSTGLRPVHFIHFIEAAINRGPNLPEGIRNHYNSVMIGKQKFLAKNLHSLCTF